ncbi:hypothetical protein B0I37DRAFT_432178 [Chaetomium sp. MPI-CAGE-AT-0009]|nr:hypothetical protein B0I37DRAFT_432178 [Chaetomium sp. MPI-CAGE-AT-0009]
MCNCALRSDLRRISQLSRHKMTTRLSSPRPPNSRATEPTKCPAPYPATTLSPRLAFFSALLSLAFFVALCHSTLSLCLRGGTPTPIAGDGKAPLLFHLRTSCRPPLLALSFPDYSLTRNQSSSLINLPISDGDAPETIQQHQRWVGAHPGLRRAPVRYHRGGSTNRQPAAVRLARRHLNHGGGGGGGGPNNNSGTTTTITTTLPPPASSRNDSNSGSCTSNPPTRPPPSSTGPPLGLDTRGAGRSAPSRTSRARSGSRCAGGTRAGTGLAGVGAGGVRRGGRGRGRGGDGSRAPGGGNRAPGGGGAGRGADLVRAGGGG